MIGWLSRSTAGVAARGEIGRLVGAKTSRSV